jgi:cell division protein FtsQ
VSRLLGPRNRRRGSDETRPRARRLGWLVGVVAGLALAAVAGPSLRDAVRRHPYFAVREVVVRGQGRLTPEHIRSRAGLEPGMSIWDVDGPGAAARLRQEPWIRSARVRRELPHRVFVTVREERPVAILATDGRGGGLYYVSSHGRIFAGLASGDARDFPYLTGLTNEDLHAGSVFGPRAIRRALALLRSAATGAGSPGPVSEIRVDRARGLVLHPVRPTVPVEVGWGRFEERLARLPRVFEVFRGREDQMKGVSLLFDDEVIVRTGPAATAPARGAGA